MYYTDIKSIDIPFLHDAALVCEMKGFKLRSLYVDPSGECAISYWGDLSLQDSTTILQNYLPNDIDINECYNMIKDGAYRKWFKSDNSEHPNGYTQIYTPDGLDYRTIQ